MLQYKKITLCYMTFCIYCVCRIIGESNIWWLAQKCLQGILNWWFWERNPCMQHKWCIFNLVVLMKTAKINTLSIIILIQYVIAITVCLPIRKLDLNYWISQTFGNRTLYKTCSGHKCFGGQLLCRET